LRYYEPGQRWNLHAHLECVPIALEHDGARTCGFRFEASPWAVGYAADLGCWTPEIARHFADVDVLALEFNHDVGMQLRSGRPAYLIRRILSDQGHLSNEQAAALFTAILEQSEPGRLHSLVQLHRSRECNRADLARAAAQAVLDRFGVEAAIHSAEQAQPGPTLRIGQRLPQFVQALLPYAECE
jgi:phosphoribosyl 1,2-cyclic phosphodiesterase